MDALDRLVLPENLNYAWLKAKKLYRTADGYVDSGEWAEFELDLENRLRRIGQQFRQGHYQLKDIRPLPRPKKIEDDKPIDRQYFHVSVDDQVAWIAIVNWLGPALDREMPPWSYGNRLYRPAWYEEKEDRRSVLEIGPYRHASGFLYRRFQHSWPLFRRHVALSVQKMAGTFPVDWQQLDPADRLAAATAVKERLPYLSPNHWAFETTRGQERTGQLHHVSFDLKQFFPRLRKQAVLNGLASTELSQSAQGKSLLNSMLSFRIDYSGIQQDYLSEVEPAIESQQMEGIPTGLFVAGFLANVAMLQIDQEIEKKITSNRSIAHFRFVDDHTVVAYDFNDLYTWIHEYEILLKKHDLGTTLNENKFDPPSFGEWYPTEITNSKAPNRDAPLKKAAIQDTKIDGKNPTKLLTKTLGQVSAIAATNFDVLDDDDLEEQLKILEWLLLADIPDRELRQDTRAAFAAGRIAMLAPRLVREADGLIDATRLLCSLEQELLHSKEASSEQKQELRKEIAEQQTKVEGLRKAHAESEDNRLRHCFGLLLQAFGEIPGKARLFQRLVEYCRTSGFKGLQQITDWLAEARSRGLEVWANYFAGLMLQTLAKGVFLSTRSLMSTGGLRSTKLSAQNFLEDVGDISLDELLMSPKSETWFHAVARKEFGIALLSVSDVLPSTTVAKETIARLQDNARKCIRISHADSSLVWVKETARRPGVWAHYAESFLSVNERPSLAWRRFDAILSFSSRLDFCAARRYPKNFSDHSWNQLLRYKMSFPVTDSGWIAEVISGHIARIEAAKESRKIAFSRAVRSIEAPSKDRITLSEWTAVVSKKCSSFDPRRSEWTALEVIRQIVSPIVEDLAVNQATLNHLHPGNILVPLRWAEGLTNSDSPAVVSWEEWRELARERQEFDIQIRKERTCVYDYRYYTRGYGEATLVKWEHILIGLGRLLLGQLRLDHNAPSIWNIRGNEQVVPLPRQKWFQSLAISSPTLLLVEGCLSARSAETRAIGKYPLLFGWQEGINANDTDLDPPLLHDPNEFLENIKKAQFVLEKNQLSVIMNQPRQLIPFRLEHFAVGPDIESEEDEIVE